LTKSSNPSFLPSHETSGLDVVAWLLVLVLPFAVFFLIGDNLLENQATFIALVSATVLMWIFRLVPDFVPGLLLILMASLLDLVPQQIAFSGFYSQIFFLVFGVFVLAAVLAESSWLARLEILLAKQGSSLGLQIFAITSTGILLTLLVPSPLGRATMIKPLVGRFITNTSGSKTTLLSLTSIHATTLLSTVFLTGNPLNFVLLAMLSEQSQGRFQWLGWLQATCVVAFICSIGLVALFIWQKRRVERLEGKRIEPQPQPDKINPVSASDWGVFCLYLVLIVGIFSQTMHQIPLAWLVMLLALAVFFFTGLSLSSLRSKVDWPTLVFIATVVAWGDMLDYLGLGEWLSDRAALLQPLFNENIYLGVSAMIAAIIGLRFIIPGAPAFMLLAATLLPFSETIGVSPWLIGFIVLTVSEAFILPYQHGVFSQAVADMDTYNTPYHLPTLVRINLFFLVLRIAAVFISIPWWRTLHLV